MSLPACLIKSDLSSLAIVTESGRSEWTAPPLRADLEPMAAWRLRVTQAASEAVQRLGGRRLALVCVDVDETMCVWLKPPSAEPVVVAAALRSVAQDWGESFVPASVQMLAEPQEPADEDSGAPASAPGARSAWQRLRRSLGRRPAAQKAPAGAVLNSPDSLVRLWLDALDGAQVRAERVASLWHVLADAFGRGPHQGTGAVVLVDSPRRIVWSWSEEGALACGGQVLLDRTPEGGEPETTGEALNEALERAAMRISLDWVSWSAQMGVTPQWIVVLGAGAERVSASLRRRWPHASVETPAEAQPIGAALARTNSGNGPAPGRCLVSLTTRPTRAMRGRYLWGAAALGLLAVALGVLAWRFDREARSMRAESARVNQQAINFVRSLGDDALTSARSPEMALESRLVELRKREPVKLPPPPRPIYDELKRALGVLAAHENVKVLQLSMDSRASAVLNFSVPDRRTGEEILLELQKASQAIAWSVSGNVPGDQQLRLTGAWR